MFGRKHSPDGVLSPEHAHKLRTLLKVFSWPRMAELLMWSLVSFQKSLSGNGPQPEPPIRAPGVGRSFKFPLCSLHQFLKMKRIHSVHQVGNKSARLLPGIKATRVTRTL